jgi:hypothetical protein
MPKKSKVTNISTKQKLKFKPPTFCHGRCVGTDRIEGICRCPKCRGLNHSTNYIAPRERKENFLDAWIRSYEQRVARLMSREVRKLAEAHKKYRIADSKTISRRHDDLLSAYAMVTKLVHVEKPRRRKAA